MREELELIRITSETKNKIKQIAKEKGFKQITVLEYLLKGKISIKEFKKYDKNTV